MTKYFILLTLVITTQFLLGCEGEDDLGPNDFVIKFDIGLDSIVGDGTTTIPIKAFMDEDADIAFRKIIFKTTDGSFIGASSDKPNEIQVTAQVFNQEVFADVSWKVPSRPGMVTITAEPVIEDLGGLFLIKDSIRVDTSAVATILLSASAFSVDNNFNKEITIVGTLKNSNGKGVSSGTMVVFTDTFASNGNMVNGRFRSENLATDISSNVSVIYSPGPVASGQDIYLTGSVLNKDGDTTTISNTIKIYITESD
ncbi:MAG: hypothetical protein AAGH46_05830 [Bacteroidota bacterium]